MPAHNISDCADICELLNEFATELSIGTSMSGFNITASSDISTALGGRQKK